jgi:hypothetical protein
MKSLNYRSVAATTFVLLLLSVDSTLTPQILQAQNRSGGFASRREYLGASKEKVYETLGIRPLDTSKEIERTIRDEMAAIDYVAGFKTDIGVTQGDGTFSHPDAGIAVSLTELQRIRQESSVTKFREILRYILAHEKSHQVQYLQYSRKAVQSEDEEQRRIFECQADVLAGKYLIESLGAPKQEDQVAILDALQVAFDLGTEEYTKYADHPSHEARRTAVRLGMAMGMIVLLWRRLPDPPVAQMIQSLGEKIDLRAGEMPLEWSYRVSKRITHYTRAASSDLVLDDRDIQWDKRAESPFVTFSLTYENVGRKTILVDMEVQCDSVSRDDPGDTKRWQKWSVKNFRFTLRPGQKYTAQGTLPWVATTDLMPRIIFPPTPTALMSVEYID